MLPGPPQPGVEHYFVPEGPGGYPGPGGYQGPGGPGGPGEPDRPAGPGRGRARVTDAFSRLGSLTPGAGFAAARRSREPDRWDPDGGLRPGESADPWDDGDAVAAGHPPARGDAATPPNEDKNRNRALVYGAGVLSVIAIIGVILAPKMFGPSDPGCKAYAGPALTAYDRTIHDMNHQAAQSQLSADMSAAMTELTQAAAQAQGSAVKSALNGLLTELKAVQGDVAAGSVPSAAVNALNAASTTADHAC